MAGALAGFIAILEMGLLALVTASLGARLIGALLPDASAEERRALGFPVGMGLLSLLTAALFFARLPAFWVLIAILACGTAWIRRDLGPVCRGAFRWVGTVMPPRDARSWLHGVMLVSGALGVIGCLAPATGWDTGVYHFAMARLRAEEGWMVVRPDVPHGYRPAFMEMLYTVGFLFQGETLASLINLAFYFAGLSLAGLWGARLGGEGGRTAAWTGYLGLTTYVLRTDGGDVEVGQAVFLTMALFALWRLREGASGRWGVLAGYALGMVLGIKYSGAWAAVAVGTAWIVVRCVDRVALRRLAAEGAIIVAIAAAVGCPWYVRNTLATGQPFFPYLQGSAVGGGEMELHGLRAVVDAMKGDSLMLAGLVALGMTSTRRVRWMVASLLLFVGLVIRQMGLTPVAVANGLRYASPAFLGLVASGSVALWSAAARRPWLGPVVTILLVGALVLAQGVHAARDLRKIPVAVGLESREAYLERKINTWWAIREAENRLPPGRGILLVEQRVYYCRAPFVGASDIQSVVGFDGITSGKEFREFLERRSIGFVVHDHSAVSKTWGFQRLLGRSPAILREARVTLVADRNDAALYRVD